MSTLWKIEIFPKLFSSNKVLNYVINYINSGLHKHMGSCPGKFNKNAVNEEVHTFELHLLPQIAYAMARASIYIFIYIQ